MLVHLILFQYIYPAERSLIPHDIVQDICCRVQDAKQAADLDKHLCRGPILSRTQYLVDLEHWGYQDARLKPTGKMSAQDIAHWTAPIDPGDRPGLALETRERVVLQPRGVFCLFVSQSYFSNL